MSYEVRIAQRLKGYAEEIKGNTETYEDAKELMDIILRAFPKTEITISMIETATNTAEAEETETETEED